MLEVLAKERLVQIEFIKLDLPTFDLPAKHTSGISNIGKWDISAAAV